MQTNTHQLCCLFDGGYYLMYRVPKLLLRLTCHHLGIPPVDGGVGVRGRPRNDKHNITVVVVVVSDTQRNARARFVCLGWTEIVEILCTVVWFDDNFGRWFAWLGTAGFVGDVIYQPNQLSSCNVCYCSSKCVISVFSKLWPRVKAQIATLFGEQPSHRQYLALSIISTCINKHISLWWWWTWAC